MSFKKVKVWIIAILCILILGISGIILSNHFHANYNDLKETDQFILKEYEDYCKKAREQDIWEGFSLENKPILAMDESMKNVYLINPNQEIHSIFAKRIKMPQEFQTVAYRISPLYPKLFSFRFAGNFNTIEQTYKLWGNDIYFIKYDPQVAIRAPFRSNHFITFLSHEAFHYYMQNNWAKGAVYSTEDLSDQDLALLYQEYEVLNNIQTALLEGHSGRETFLPYAKDYVTIVQQRLENNPDYVKKELDRETIEGTATYVGIKASRNVGYDYGVMYFDNIKDVPFSSLETTVEAGSYSKSSLAERIPYETGALLCLLMDQLEIPDWQETLNSQTPQEQTTLFTVIQTFLEENEG